MSKQLPVHTNLHIEYVDHDVRIRRLEQQVRDLAATVEVLVEALAESGRQELVDQARLELGLLTTPSLAMR